MIESVIGAFGQAFSTLLEPGTTLFLVLGCAIGILFGVLPGVGTVLGLALALPFTFGMEPDRAMFFLAGIVGGVPFSGSVTSILINVPGGPVNVATCWDGYPMAQKGEANKAIAISATSSALGTIFGLLVLAILIPLVRQVLFAFGPPEIFMLALWGLSAVSIAVGGNVLKGVASAALGLLFAFVGFSNVTGVLRFVFGTEYLWDGIPLIPFFVGLFGISEVLALAGSKTISRSGVALRGSKLDGIREVFKHKVCFVRSSVIGTIIGIIPGIGGSVSNILAYLFSVAASKTPEKFGTGYVEGVIAPESANTSTIGGDLLPTLAFGVPGSAAMAVLLGGFILVGLVPGPSLVRDHLDVVFSLVLGVFLSGILACCLGLFTASFLARVTTVNVSYLIPIVASLCLLGAYGERGNIWDVVTAVVVGYFSYAMKQAGYSVVPMVIGFMLGGLAETTLLQSLMMSEGSLAIFVTRPVSIVIFIIIILSVASPFLLKARKRVVAAEG